MLIKVFGIWLMASNINHLEPAMLTANNCQIVMNSTPRHRSTFNTDLTCDEVAAEINKQLKDNK